MTGEIFEITEKIYVGYTQGDAYIISYNKTSDTWAIWEAKEDVEDLVELLNKLEKENKDLRKKVQTKQKIIETMSKNLEKLGDDSKLLPLLHEAQAKVKELEVMLSLQNESRSWKIERN